MTTEQMTRGLKELENGTIPIECLTDMLPVLVNMLTKLMVIENHLLITNEEKYRTIKAILSLDLSA